MSQSMRKCLFLFLFFSLVTFTIEIITDSNELMLTLERLSREKNIADMNYFKTVLTTAKNESNRLHGLEVTAIKAARNFTRGRVSHSKTILCAVFISSDSSEVKTLRNNIAIARNSCEWAVVVYKGSRNIKKYLTTITAEHESRLVLYDMKTANKRLLHNGPTYRSLNFTFIPKPLLYPILLPLLPHYQFVWLLDEDISFRGFDLEAYLHTVNCVNYPFRAPMVSQPLIKENTQVFEDFNSRAWKDIEAIAVPSSYIEQQAPLLDATFFDWYIRYVAMPMRGVVEILGTDWGNDKTWCRASIIFSNEAYREKQNTKTCMIVIGGTPIHHKRAKTLEYRSRIIEFYALGFQFEDLMTSHFPSLRKDFSLQRVNRGNVIKELPICI